MITTKYRAQGWRTLWLLLSLCVAACASARDTEGSAAPSAMASQSGSMAPAGSNRGAAVSPAAMPASVSNSAGSPATTRASQPATAGAAAASTAGSAAANSGGTAATRSGDIPAANGGAHAAGSGSGPAAGSGGVNGGTASATDADRDLAIPCPVWTALANACHVCHGKVPTNGAPMSLVTMADFQVLSVQTAKIPKYELARMRIDGSRRPPMPPDGWPLMEEDRKTLLDWLNAAAPAAEGDNSSCP